MGLVGDWLKSHHMEDPVRGTAYVVSASMPDPTATTENYQMTLVVQADGVPATTVQHSGMASTGKWPQPGETLPVTIDRKDPTRVKIEWDEMKTSQQQGIDQAQQMADMLRKANPAGSPAPATSGAAGAASVFGAPASTSFGRGSTVVIAGHTIDSIAFPGVPQEMMALVAQHRGDPVALRAGIMDLFAKHGIQVPTMTAMTPAAAPAQDPATRLHELDSLHQQGLVTDDEYAAQRKHIIEGV
jgi:hypothetical protein